jgi:hypothetical protein
MMRYCVGCGLGGFYAVAGVNMDIYRYRYVACESDKKAVTD